MEPATLVRHEVQEEGGIHVLLLDNPKGNIIDRQLCGALRRELALAAEARDARLLVVRGAGGNFSFGASVKEHLPEEAPAMLADLGAVVLELATFPYPTLAAVEGKCLGGGFELALACGFMFVCEDAVVGNPEIKLGVFAPASTALLAGAIPRARLEEILLTGRNLSAEELVRWGLANRVVSPPSRERMDEEILAFARWHLLRHSAASLRVATRAARQGDLARRLQEMERLYVEELLPLHDGSEGIRAFLEKRTPTWKNE